MGRRSKVYRNADGKECTSCGRFHEWNKYSHVSASPDKRNSRCDECRRRHDREAFHRSKGTYEDKRNALKNEYVQAMGGKCARCGYNEFLSGLDFHHIQNKEQPVAALITNARSGNAKWLSLLEYELTKCILLCRNCHGALHANDWVMTEVKEPELSRYESPSKHIGTDLIGLPLFEQ